MQKKTIHLKGLAPGFTGNSFYDYESLLNDHPNKNLRNDIFENTTESLKDYMQMRMWQTGGSKLNLSDAPDNGQSPQDIYDIFENMAESAINHENNPVINDFLIEVEKGKKLLEQIDYLKEVIQDPKNIVSTYIDYPGPNEKTGANNVYCVVNLKNGESVEYSYTHNKGDDTKPYKHYQQFKDGKKYGVGIERNKHSNSFDLYDKYGERRNIFNNDLEKKLTGVKFEDNLKSLGGLVADDLSPIDRDYKQRLEAMKRAWKDYGSFKDKGIEDMPNMLDNKNYDKIISKIEAENEQITKSLHEGAVLDTSPSHKDVLEEFQEYQSKLVSLSEINESLDTQVKFSPNSKSSFSLN